MIIGSPKEQIPIETRIALTPSVVQKLTAHGHHIILEKNYGAHLGFFDTAYLNSGAQVTTSSEIYRTAEIILTVNPLQIKETTVFKHCNLIIADFTNYPENYSMPNTKILRLECVPRTSVAQSIDILSSQSIARGYMAATYALFHAKRIAPQLITAATSIKALSALVIGASTTGLQAATTLKRAGCKVTIADISEKAQEVATSVGAEFSLSHSKENLSALLKDKPIVISTALPTVEILNDKNLPSKASFSLYIDTTPKNLNIQSHLPYIQFYRNTYFERLAPLTASDLWANNMLNLLSLILPKPDKLDLNLDYIKPMIS